MLAYFYRNESACDDAIACAIEMLKKLDDYNETNRRLGDVPSLEKMAETRAVEVGIGLNSEKSFSEPSATKTVLTSPFLETRSIPTSRIETLTKHMGASLIVHESVIRQAHTNYVNPVHRGH